MRKWLYELVNTRKSISGIFSGIRSFRRQTTKEDRLKTGFSFGEDSILPEEEEEEDVDQIRDDLESTKQLLELEVRSKKLLEKDNKRLQAEMDRLRTDYQKLLQGGGQGASTTEPAANGTSNPETTPRSARRASIASKRQSMIRYGDLASYQFEFDSLGVISCLWQYVILISNLFQTDQRERGH